jgi:ABC-2 type transport system permease protein
MLVELSLPVAGSLIIVIVTLYALAVIFFLLSHTIATWSKRFGVTYAITMMVYFIFMIMCGIFGIQIEMMPKWLQTIARLLPMSYVNEDFVDFWAGGSYNFAPFVQSLIFMAAVAAVLWIMVAWREKRVIK